MNSAEHPVSDRELLMLVGQAERLTADPPSLPAARAIGHRVVEVLRRALSDRRGVEVIEIDAIIGAVQEAGAYYRQSGNEDKYGDGNRARAIGIYTRLRDDVLELQADAATVEAAEQEYLDVRRAIISSAYAGATPEDRRRITRFLFDVARSVPTGRTAEG